MGQRQGRRCGSSILYQSVAVLLFVAVLAFPLISATPSEAAAASDTSSDTANAGHSNQHYNHHHHRRRHQHPRAGVDEQQHSEDVGDAANVAPKVLVGYADSYITKQAAMELQDTLRHLRQPVTEEQYNELLQKLVTKPKADPSHPIINKMYYDFVSETKEQHPAQAAGGDEELQEEEVREEKSEDVIDLSEKVKKLRKKSFKKAHSTGDKVEFAPKDEQQQQGERRAKRSVEEEQTEDDRQIGKRQTGVWNNQYQQQEHRRRFESRRTFSAADHDFDDQPAHYLASNNWAQASAPQYHSAYVSPWTNRFSSVHRIPGPSNYYLPVATPPEYTQFIVRPPYQPWMSIPIPGVVYNPAFPPKNPPPFIAGLRPSVPVIRPDTNSIAEEDTEQNGNTQNRFGGDEEDNDRFIFDVEERTTTQRPFRTFTQSPPSRFTTRRPPPPLIRDSDNTEAAIDDIFGNNQFNFNQPPRTTTRRPPPPLIRNPEDASDRQSANNNFARFPTTRRPPPPLIRDSDNTEAAINNIFGNNQFNFNQPPRTTTRRPPPPLIRNPEDAADRQSSNTNFGSTNTIAQPEAQRTSRPQIINPTRAPARLPPPFVARTTTTTTPRAPAAAAPVPQQDEGLSGCVWAIVNCCSSQNRQVRYSCFERFDCVGAFWDINPCNEDVFDSALDAADKFAQ